MSTCKALLVTCRVRTRALGNPLTAKGLKVSVHDTNRCHLSTLSHYLTHNRWRTLPRPPFMVSPSRTYQSITPKNPSIVESPTKSVPTKVPKEFVGESVIVTQAEQRRSDWSIMKKLFKHVWPQNDWYTRGRVLLGFGLLISGKVRYLSNSLAFLQKFHSRRF
jgi:hypothetical protein